jgi:hypothetical protein
MKIKLKEIEKLIKERLSKLAENQPKPETTPRPGETETVPGTPPDEEREFPFTPPKPFQLPKPKATKNEGMKVEKLSQQEIEQVDKIMQKFKNLGK